MTKAKIIIWGLIAVLTGVIIYLYVQFKKLMDATWTYSGFRVKSIDLKNVVLTIFMKIQNEGSLSITIESQEYDAFLNGTLVSRLKNTTPFLLKPGASYMPLDVSINLGDAIKAGLKNIQSLVSDKSKSNIIIKGTYTLRIGILSVRDIKFEEKFNLGEF
jgi:LEA14-like dessication related protein